MKAPVSISLRRLSILGVAAVLTTSACSGGGSSSSNVKSATLVDGGTFTIAVPYDPGSLNPFTSWPAGNPFFPSPLAYDSLISQDAKGEVQPLLAEKWEANNNEASFSLRKGITCADGAPLTASDVAANINFVGDKKNASVLAGAFVQLGTTATADDAARTISVKSGNPDAFLLADVGSLPIVCKKGLNDQKTLDAGTNGTSLFKVTSAKPGTSYTLERRTDYTWGPGDWDPKQKGLPDKIIVKVVPNPTTTANLLLARDVNFGIALKPSDEKRLKDIYTDIQPLPTGVFLFNEAKGRPFEDEAVRRAYVQAIDLKQQGAVIGGGTGQPSKQINEYVQPNVCPADTITGNLPTFDVAAAKAGLEKAGWTVGSDGIREKDGKKLVLQQPVLNSFPGFISSTELTQKALREVGIDLKVKPVNGTGYSEEVFTKTDFDVVIQSWAFPTPSQMVSSHSGPSPRDGGSNVGSIDNPAYDTLVKQASAKVGQDGCDLWNDAERELIKRVDVVPFWSNPSTAYGSGAKFTISQFTWSIRMTK